MAAPYSYVAHAVPAVPPTVAAQGRDGVWPSPVLDATYPMTRVGGSVTGPYRGEYRHHVVVATAVDARPLADGSGLLVPVKLHAPDRPITQPAMVYQVVVPTALAAARGTARGLYPPSGPAGVPYVGATFAAVEQVLVTLAMKNGATLAPSGTEFLADWTLHRPGDATAAGRALADEALLGALLA